MSGFPTSLEAAASLAEIAVRATIVLVLAAAAVRRCVAPRRRCATQSWCSPRAPSWRCRSRPRCCRLAGAGPVPAARTDGRRRPRVAVSMPASGRSRPRGRRASTRTS